MTATHTHTHGYDPGHSHDHDPHEHAHAALGLDSAEADDEAAPFRHAHAFLGRDHDRNARKTRAVLVLTAAMMAFEIAAGLYTHSLALLADGLHMATHAGVMLMAVAAYALAHRRQGDRRYSFGVGKFGDLAAFSSAIVLAVTALGIFIEAVERLLTPQAVAFWEALPVAALGLCVNLLSAWLLRNEPHHHGHDHGHAHDPNDHAGHDHAGHDHAHHDHPQHDHDERDLNLRAAYVHVAADAAVSVLAICGLFLGARFGWTWTDAAVGIVGAFVIGRWSWGLMRDAGAVLVDMTPSGPLEAQVQARLTQSGERLADLHVWRLGPGAMSVSAVVVSRQPLSPQGYRDRLGDLPQVRHAVIEVVAI